MKRRWTEKGVESVVGLRRWRSLQHLSIERDGHPRLKERVRTGGQRLATSEQFASLVGLASRKKLAAAGTRKGRSALPDPAPCGYRVTTTDVGPAARLHVPE